MPPVTVERGRGRGVTSPPKNRDFKRILGFYHDGAALCALDGALAKDWPRCGGAAQAAN